MKLNKKICFIVFAIYIICSSFSVYNRYAFSVIENGKTAITVSKPESVEPGFDFLLSVRNILNNADIDFLIRQTDIKSDMLVGRRYYSSDMSTSFININRDDEISNYSADIVISNFSSTDFTNRIVMKPSPVGNTVSVTSVENLKSVETSQIIILVSDSDVPDCMRLLRENRFSVDIYEGGVISDSNSSGLFLSGIIFCISVLFFELSSGKRDIILKTAGFDAYNILFWKIKNEMKYYGITMLITISMMIVLAKAFFHTSIADYFLQQFDNLALVCMFVGTSLLISITIPIFHKRYSFVTGAKPDKNIYRIGMIIHAAAITIFTVIILQTLHGFLLPELEQAIELKQRASEVENIASLKLYTGGEEDTFLEYAERNPDKVNELYLTLNAQYDAVMIDDSDMKRSNFDGKYVWELNDKGFDFPHIVVNGNYLIRNRISDVDNRIISRDSAKNNEILILIPASFDYSDPREAYAFWKERGSYGDCELKFIRYDPKCEIPLYTNGLTQISPLAPVIEVYPDDSVPDMSCLENLLSNCYFTAKTDHPYEEIYPLLLKIGAAEVVTNADYIGNIFKEKLADELTGIEVVIGELLLYVIAITGLIVFNASNYVAANIKRIVCNITEGKAITDCVKNYYLALGTTYFISAILSVVYSGTFFRSLPSVWAFLLSWGIITTADLVFSIFQLRSITLKNYYSVIKGEN